jgi:putative flippase GtrA
VTTTGEQATQRGAEVRFDSAVRALWRRLPGRLRAWVAPTVVGFSLINGFTFGVDLALLAALYRGAGLPHPVAITLGYAAAFTLAFVLNRWLNFHVHGPVGGQLARYVVVVAINYLALILGIGSGLTALGVPFLVARVAAGLAEAVWMYSAMRWWVFGRR